MVMIEQLVNRNFYTPYNRGRTSNNSKEELVMNKVLKTGVKICGFVGSILLTSKVMGLTGTLIRSLDKNDEPEEEVEEESTESTEEEAE